MLVHKRAHGDYFWGLDHRICMYADFGGWAASKSWLRNVPFVVHRGWALCVGANRRMTRLAVHNGANAGLPTTSIPLCLRLPFISKVKFSPPPILAREDLPFGF